MTFGHVLQRACNVWRKQLKLVIVRKKEDALQLTTNEDIHKSTWTCKPYCVSRLYTMTHASIFIPAPRHIPVKRYLTEKRDDYCSWFILLTACWRGSNKLKLFPDYPNLSTFCVFSLSFRPPNPWPCPLCFSLLFTTDDGDLQQLLFKYLLLRSFFFLFDSA